MKFFINYSFTDKKILKEKNNNLNSLDLNIIFKTIIKNILLKNNIEYNKKLLTKIYDIIINFYFNDYSKIEFIKCFFLFY